MRKLRRKLNLKSILSATLVCALLVGSVFGLTSVLGKKEKRIAPLAFSQGSLNNKGIYVESKTSIYTKDLFECQGLTVTPDFEAEGSFQVFYYDENKNFIGATERLSAIDGVYTKGDTFVFAKYSRIMIIPEVPTDENGVKKDDFKIRFYQVTGYARDYTITVNKVQNFKINNLVVIDKTMNGKHWSVNDGEAKTLKLDEGREDYTSTEFIDVSNYDTIKMYVPLTYASGPYMQIFMADEDTFISHKVNYTDYTIVDGYALYELTVPRGAQYFVTSLPKIIANDMIIIGE